MGASIRHIEYVTGETEILNSSFKEKWFNYDFKRFEKKVGIKKRFKVKTNENIISLSTKVCEKLFKTNVIEKDEIDYLILCTQSPEHPLPTNSCIIQDKLKLRTDIGCLDINLGCSGFVYCLSLAKGLISSNQAKNILIVTAETYSKYIHKDDLINQLIFSDAAAVTLVSHSEEEKIGNFSLGTDGAGFDKLIVKNNYFNKLKNPTLNKISEFISNDDNSLYMNGPEVFNFTLNRVPDLIKKTLEINKIEENSIDYFVPHQANKFLLNSIRKRSKIPEDKFIINFNEIGNTVSSTIPIALKTLSESLNLEKKENKILICGFGVGLSWGAVTITIKI
jgi:3-oxoacyl-[acyl-carrier-protein] synthase-3